MWFKQVTCDCCFKPLASVGRHNKYFAAKILEFNKVTPLEFRLNYSHYNNPNEMRFNYDTSPYCYGGYVYCYKMERLTPNNWSTWFCGNKCALDAAKKMNSILFYFDENEHSVSFITPQMVEINRAIQESDYTPLLMMEWKEQFWFEPRSSYQDLRQYGFDMSYPTFSLPLCNVIKPKASLLNDYKALLLDPSFEKDFWGANNENVRNSVLELLPKFLGHVDVDFGRRMMIEWFITDALGRFIGFIHLTCMSPALPYKWVVEFGMVEGHRRKGIMKAVLRRVASWAQQNGCDKLYAISEDHNVASHKTLKSLPYPVQENRSFMTDDKAGYRPMRIFIIDLI